MVPAVLLYLYTAKNSCFLSGITVDEDCLKPMSMIKQLKQAEMFFICFYLIACLVAFALAMGMLLIPLAMLMVVVLAIREIIIWKRKEAKQTVPVKVVQKRRTRQLPRISVAPVLYRLKQQFQFSRNHRRMTLDF